MAAGTFVEPDDEVLFLPWRKDHVKAGHGFADTRCAFALFPPILDGHSQCCTPSISKKRGERRKPFAREVGGPLKNWPGSSRLIRTVYAGAGLFFIIFAQSVTPVPETEVYDFLAGREEQLKFFRQKRDFFFREDPHSPLPEKIKKNFKGLDYYPIDLRYAVTGVIEKPTSHGNQTIYVNLPTNKGKDRKYVRYGRFRFRLDGRQFVLFIFRPLGAGELFLPFKDLTSERDTYRLGRYLFIEPLPDGRVLVDFNRAHNPFCAYNEKFTCPFAPPENWLDIEIRAGEKRFRP